MNFRFCNIPARILLAECAFLCMPKKVRERCERVAFIGGGELTGGAIWWASGAPGTHGNTWTQQGTWSAACICEEYDVIVDKENNLQQQYWLLADDIFFVFVVFLGCVALCLSLAFPDNLLVYHVKYDQGSHDRFLTRQLLSNDGIRSNLANATLHYVFCSKIQV
ncbi:hypothetical protein OIU84_019276 [Salix udensis]|uniref:Uncharacterized protein n=1 Tax=Salix udensis TaxID=889485 RepID=A0AAD6PJ80_9ROSI|nr:hypothetical protein OIU84_019276 [Salix udensis]